MERDNSKRRKTRSGRIDASQDVRKRIHLFEKELIKINKQRKNEINQLGIEFQWGEREELEKQVIIKFWYGGGLKKKTGQDVIAFVGTRDELEHFLRSYDVEKHDLHESVPGDKTEINLNYPSIDKVGFADALRDAYNRSPEFRERLDDMINRTIYPWRGMFVNTMAHIGQSYGQSHNLRDVARNFAKKSSGYKGGRRRLSRRRSRD